MENGANFRFYKKHPNFLDDIPNYALCKNQAPIDFVIVSDARMFRYCELLCLLALLVLLSNRVTNAVYGPGCLFW